MADLNRREFIAAAVAGGVLGFREEVRRISEAFSHEDLALQAGSTQLVVERTTDACRPAVDIASLASRGSTAPAVLARLVLDLDRWPEPREAFTRRVLDDARRVAHAAAGERAFAGLSAALDAESGVEAGHVDPEDAAALAQRLRGRAVAILGALLEQQA